MKKLFVLFILSSCTHFNIKLEQEQLQECIRIQQSIYRGFETSLPAYCYKFEKHPDMNRVIEQ